MKPNSIVSIIKIIVRCKWCNKTRSLLYSFKCGGGGAILVAPKTEIRISPKAKVYIDGILEINKPWGKRQIFPASFEIEDEGELYVKGKFSFFSGCRISVNSHAHLILHNGFMNENCVIACFERIEIGNEVIAADDVIIRDSDYNVPVELDQQ